jgi:serine/threonine protein kinase
MTGFVPQWQSSTDPAFIDTDILSWMRPERYSQALRDIVKSMLDLDPLNRPKAGSLVNDCDKARVDWAVERKRVVDSEMEREAKRTLW